MTSECRSAHQPYASLRGPCSFQNLILPSIALRGRLQYSMKTPKRKGGRSSNSMLPRYWVTTRSRSLHCPAPVHVNADHMPPDRWYCFARFDDLLVQIRFCERLNLDRRAVSLPFSVDRGQTVCLACTVETTSIEQQRKLAEIGNPARQSAADKLPKISCCHLCVALQCS